MGKKLDYLTRKFKLFIIIIGRFYLGFGWFKIENGLSFIDDKNEESFSLRGFYELFSKF